MISEKLRGVLTASITPVAENGALDCDAVARLVKYYRQSGLRGALFPSSTGESFALTAEERVALVRVAAHAASDDFSILGNCSEHNWKDALRNARAMADAGGRRRVYAATIPGLFSGRTARLFLYHCRSKPYTAPGVQSYDAPAQ